MLNVDHCGPLSCRSHEICGRTQRAEVCNEHTIDELLKEFSPWIKNLANERLGKEITRSSPDPKQRLELLFPHEKKAGAKAFCQDLRKVTEFIDDTERCGLRPGSNQICVPSRLCHDCADAKNKDLAAKIFQLYNLELHKMNSLREAWEAWNASHHYEEPESTYELLFGKPSCSSASRLQRFATMDEQEIKQSAPISTLNWNRNSCYCDAVLVALLANPNTWIVEQIERTEQKQKHPATFSTVCESITPAKEKSILQRIHQEVLRVFHEMHNPERTGTRKQTDIRELLDQCPTRGVEKFKYSMDESFRFLDRLLRLLHIPNGIEISKTEISGSTDPDFPMEVRREIGTEMIEIIIQLRVLAQDVSMISHLLPYPLITKEKSNPRKHSYERTESVIVHAPYAILRYNRLLVERKINRKAVQVARTIKLGKDTLMLEAVVCYTKSHYVTFFRHRMEEDKKEKRIPPQEIWFFYDDLQPQSLEQMDFDFMANVVERMGTLYFYSRVESL